MKKPVTFSWRSPLFSFFDENAHWQSIGDSEIVATITDAASAAFADSDSIADTDSNTDSADAKKAILKEAKKIELQNAQKVGLCDLSPLSRIGGKGKITKNAPAVNTMEIKDHLLFCRVGEDEAFVLSTNEDKAVLGDYLPQPRIHIPRRDSHCQIGLCGAHADEVLARLCSISPPQYPHLLQTRAADLSVLIIPAIAESNAQPAYYILADSGYALHIWNALYSVATKLGGGIIGWKQWQKVCNIKK